MLRNKKVFFYLSLIVICFLSVFAFGFIVGKFKSFPYSWVQSSYQTLKELPIWADRPIDDLRYVNIAVDPADLERSLSVSLKHSQELRESVLKRTIIDKKMVKISRVPISQNEQKIQASFYGIRIRSLLTQVPQTESKKSCLRIYIQGHGGNPFDFDYHKKIRSDSLEYGCDFLSMSMLGLGLNEGKVSFPRNNQTISLTLQSARNHLNYAYFRDRNQPTKDPLALFLSGHYYTITELMNNYDTISLIGFSGGGWYAVWLAALIPQIDNSLSYAGTLPLDYRFFANKNNEENFDPGDWEQTLSKLYDDIDYWGLYLLMTIDKQGNQSRNAFLIYNDHDSCCFNNPDASHLKSTIERINVIMPRVVVVEKSYRHSLDPQVIKSIFESNKIVTSIHR